LYADHQTIPARPQNRLQIKIFCFYVYKPNAQTIQVQAQQQLAHRPGLTICTRQTQDSSTHYIATLLQAIYKALSVCNAYSYSYTTTRAKQHRGQINTVKQKEAEQATEQEAPTETKIP
jgi:hypothetical protein